MTHPAIRRRPLGPATSKDRNGTLGGKELLEADSSHKGEQEAPGKHGPGLVGPQGWKTGKVALSTPCLPSPRGDVLSQHKSLVPTVPPESEVS